MIYRKSSKLIFLVALSLVAVVSLSLVKRTKASDFPGKYVLVGSWQATLIGNTGCGLSTSLVTFTLDESGVATNATNTGHFLIGSPCADGSVSTGNTFQILTLNSDGSGTANLSCGVACGWNFHIQVDPSLHIFNIVDVDPANPNNLLQGVAIKKS